MRDHLSLQSSLLKLFPLLDDVINLLFSRSYLSYRSFYQFYVEKDINRHVNLSLLQQTSL